mmetsp:Transcript_43214/g.99623  ORF Transcript_43214/g.99623 Transcript_43214/m.99623 type:complete len:108 (+) Transcript_43214:111-434(+)
MPVEVAYNVSAVTNITTLGHLQPPAIPHQDYRSLALKVVVAAIVIFVLWHCCRQVLNLIRPSPTPPPLLGDTELGDTDCTTSRTTAILWVPSGTAPTKEAQEGFQQF